MTPGAIRLFYSACLCAILPFLLLYYLLRVRTDGKYRENYRYRVGIKLPDINVGRSPRIWFHALSVGETLSVLPLIEEIKKLRPDIEAVFSTATETGMALARKRAAPYVTEFFYMPHDFPWTVRSLIRRLRPDLFILTETDVWPNLLLSLSRAGVPRILVNGRISPKSFRRLLPFRRFLKALYGLMDLVFVQSRDDVARYEALGVSPHLIHAMGNLKYDSLAGPVPEDRIAAIRESAGIGTERTVWIAGSTHEGEEEILLDIHLNLRKTDPNLLLVLAPRSIGRRKEIESLCETRALPCAPRSSGIPASGKAVYILDTLGELASFYALADAAFIGGSLVPFGGHNPLEATAQGKPAVWGPHMFNFREIERDLIDAGCGVRVKSEPELENVLGGSLMDPVQRRETAVKARSFISAHSGAGERIARMLRERFVKCRE